MPHFSLPLRFGCKYAWLATGILECCIYPNTQNAVFCPIYCYERMWRLHNKHFIFSVSVFSLIEIIQSISLFLLRFRSWQNSGLVVGKKSIIFSGLVTCIHLWLNTPLHFPFKHEFQEMVVKLIVISQWVSGLSGLFTRIIFLITHLPVYGKFFIFFVHIQYTIKM